MLRPDRIVVRVVVISVAAAICLSVALILIIFWRDAPGVRSFETIRDSYRKSEALLLDRNGQILHETRVDKKGRRLEWAPFADISPALVRAVLFVEDRRFFEHRGVDWRALGASIFSNAASGRRRGASTITMQLAATLDKRLKAKGMRRGVIEKWRQIKAAMRIEKEWTKQQILEAYLNLVTFRGELQGVTAASRGLFDKAPGGLDSAESLTLASLITSPNAEAARVLARSDFFYRSMKGEAMAPTTKERIRERMAMPYLIRPAGPGLAPHVAHMVMSGRPEAMGCTIDRPLQTFVLESLNHHLTLLKGSNVSDGAALVVDNKTGEVLAYAGNSGPSSSAPYVDGIRAPRQAGSTLKPFLYGLAIEKRLLTAASLLDDSPVHIPTPTGLYVPRNYDNDFHGPVALRRALSSSLNVPAVRALLVTGIAPFLNRLRNLGFSSLPEDAEFYGYSIALGSADVTLWDLVNGYRTLANGGIFSPVVLTQDVTVAKRRVMAENASFIISSILSDRESRSLTFGLENPLATRFWTAVKTGTSKDMRDNWCVGYSRYFTVGVWVGNFSGEPMRNVSGVSGAAPVWTEIMNYLHAKRPSIQPMAPADITVAEVTFKNAGVEQGRREFFMPGTEPISVVSADHRHRKPSIVYPSNDTLIALDPDIPEEVQIVPMRFDGGGERYEWIVDGVRTGVSGQVLMWKPQPGGHVAAIVDRANNVVDSVGFVVR